MSIHDFVINIKSKAEQHRKMLIFIALVAGSSVISFYLGYTARAESHKENLVSIECPLSAYIDPTSFSSGSNNISSKSVTSSVAGSGAYVASKNGKKYYPVNCGAANRIKEGNKVYFQTEASAQSAGYSLGSGCSS